jgi:hypothetical protein
MACMYGTRNEASKCPNPSMLCILSLFCIWTFIAFQKRLKYWEYSTANDDIGIQKDVWLSGVRPLLATRVAKGVGQWLAISLKNHPNVTGDSATVSLALYAYTLCIYILYYKIYVLCVHIYVYIYIQYNYYIYTVYVCILWIPLVFW